MDMIATQKQLDALRTLSTGTPEAKKAIPMRTFKSLVRRYFATVDWNTGERQITSTGRGLLAQKDHWAVQQPPSFR